MNRQTLLAVIHQHLRESLAETGSLRPLGEIVGSVAREIRNDATPVTQNGSVLPIELVAAFVDGDLSEEESAAVCQAALVDNSVIAELVSAVRALQKPADQMRPISDQLTSQLLAMQGSLATEEPATASQQAIHSETKVDRSQSPAPSSTALKSTAPTHVSIATQSHGSAAAPRTRRASRKNWVAAVVLLGTAAAIGFAIFVASRPADQPDSNFPRIVKEDPKPKPEPNEEPEQPLQSSPKSDALVDNPSLDPASEPAPQQKVVVPETPNVPNDPRHSNNDSVASQEMHPNDPQPDQPLPQPDEQPAAKRPTQLVGGRWNDVAGVLTKLTRSETSSQSRAAIWEATGGEGDGFDVPTKEGQLLLKTLPMSRAEATFDGGAKIVISSDAAVRLQAPDQQASARVWLQHGGLALVDMLPGTRIELIKSGKLTTTLDWQTKSSVVLQYGSSGLDIQVHGGTVKVNDIAVTNKTKTVTRTLKVQAGIHPQRKPRWVDRPVETIKIKQPFLAQIQKSNNVMATVNQQMKGLLQSDRITDADRQTLATLARWQASLSGENLFRLAYSQFPIARLAALNQLVTLPRWDPRYARVWAGVESASRDKQRVQRFKRWCLMLQLGGAANQAQLNAMVDDLMAPEIGSRAMSDYLLRQFLKNQQRLPNFDPTWTGNSQLRGVNQWRAYFGRPAVNNQRNQRVQGAAAAN